MSGMRAILSTSAVIVCVGAGCGLWALVVSEEDKQRELYKVIQMNGFNVHIEHMIKNITH